MTTTTTEQPLYLPREIAESLNDLYKHATAILRIVEGLLEMPLTPEVKERIEEVKKTGQAAARTHDTARAAAATGGNPDMQRVNGAIIDAQRAESEALELVHQLSERVDNRFAGFGKVLGLTVADDGTVTLTGDGVLDTVVELDEAINGTPAQPGLVERVEKLENVKSSGNGGADLKVGGALVVGAAVFVLVWLIIGSLMGATIGLFWGVGFGIAAMAAMLALSSSRSTPAHTNDTARGDAGGRN